MSRLLQEIPSKAPRKAEPNSSKTLVTGDLVIIRYFDHVRFEAADASFYKPWILEEVGWLDYEDDEFIRIVQERYPEPMPSGNARLRSSGVCIVKSTIVELRPVSHDVRQSPGR